jgi:NADPH:quinone reductase-like Zn-dependent oxidoreductase
MDPNTYYEMHIGVPGRHPREYFIRKRPRQALLLPHEIIVETKPIGINFKDLAVFNGKHEGNSTSLECAGIVRRISHCVTKFTVGDKVMGLSLAKYQNYHYAPQSQFHM